jgi:hypothetical protein
MKKPILAMGLFIGSVAIDFAYCQGNRVRTAGGSPQGNLPMKICLHARSFGLAEGESIPLFTECLARI